ncbi:carbohydrate esterase / alpha-galactosidase [Nitzschia inconspicua]|uniref:Carbohydrate esterase / alpha-galactosidase n=1 Tax=Nitzschia inconspicua TaxID=303405 RepID=A0A9K3PIY7_9STRA|nr:carbohydrate esterase / alpha-galactosidase [Nitzschia inconspicua]
MSIFAKSVLVASCTFMLASLLAAIMDPLNSMNGESVAYFGPHVERREDVMENRRMLLEQQRSLFQSHLQERRQTLRGSNYTLLTPNEGYPQINIDRISEEVSKRIAKDIASHLDVKTISNQVLQQFSASDATKEALPAENSEHHSEISREPSVVDKANKPVKIFILMGQSNMAGQGDIYGDRDGDLEYAILKKNRYRHLIHEQADGNYTWATKEDVRYVHIDSESQKFNIKRNGELSVKNAEGPKRKIGPEVGIGWILGDQYPDEPILLLKVCTGNRNLGWDLLPPGSERFEMNGRVYAGYHDLEESWKNDTQPNQPENITVDFLKSHPGWYGGKQYDLDTNNAKKVLSKLDKFYPGAKSGYEISGFFYWQGEKDRRNDVYSHRYEANLVQFIRSVRSEFNATSAPFVVSSVAFDGHTMEGNTRKVFEAQMSVDGHRRKYPDFFNNVKSVDTRNIWQDIMGEIRQTEHYGSFGEAYIEAGSAMGWAMVQLLKQL